LVGAGPTQGLCHSLCLTFLSLTLACRPYFPFTNASPSKDSSFPLRVFFLRRRRILPTPPFRAHRFFIFLHFRPLRNPGDGEIPSPSHPPPISFGSLGYHSSPSPSFLFSLSPLLAIGVPSAFFQVVCWSFPLFVRDHSPFLPMTETLRPFLPY